MGNNLAPNNRLEFVSMAQVKAGIQRFFAKKKFTLDVSPEAEIKIRHLSEDFHRLFLSGDGKVEEPIGEQSIYCYDLQQPSLDRPVIEDFGGEERVKTTLYELYALMSEQSNGEEGVLLTDGFANILYIPDQQGVLRAVSVNWFAGAWNIYADSIESSDKWSELDRVFSRSLVPESSEPSAPAQA